MSRRAIQATSALIALLILAVVLYNATLVDRVPPKVNKVWLSATALGFDLVGQTLTTIDVQFSEPVRTATLEGRFHITPSVPGAITWDGQQTAIFTPSSKLPLSTTFAITIDAGVQDLAGNAASIGLAPWKFTTVGPPSVAATSPTAGGGGVAVSAPIQITFDRLMSTSSVDGAIAISPTASYHLSWNADTVTLTLDSPLQFSTLYTVAVGASAVDTDGNHLSPMTFSFTTVTNGLVATSVVPAANGSGISVQTPIAITFDGPIDPASIASAFQLTPPVTGTVQAIQLPDDRPIASPAPGSPTPAATGRGPANVLVFTPSQPLAAHTTYTVTLGSGVHALGDPSLVAASTTWTFTTGQPAQTAQNQVVFLSSRSGVANVWMMNPDGSNARQVTTELVPVSSYDVSPDGSTVAYSAAGTVKRMKIDGSGLTVMTQAGRHEYAPTFAPDGLSLLVARRDAAGSDLGYWQVPLPGGSGDERQVLPNGAPPLDSVDTSPDQLDPGPGTFVWSRRAAWSADGTKLLIVDGTGRARLVDLTQPLTQPATDLGLFAFSAPVWSPADRAFLLIGQPANGGAISVWRMPATPGASPVALMAGVGAVAVSTGGSVATLEVSTTGSGPVHLALSSGSNTIARPITTDVALSDRMPGFSPDGSTVIFVRVLADRPTRSAGIWLVAPDGSGLRQIATDGSYPRWLP